MKSAKNLWIVVVVLAACWAVQPAWAAEAWYLYVALDGSDGPTSPPGNVNSYAPDGSLAWESEVHNAAANYRWFSVAFSPVTRFVNALSHDYTDGGVQPRGVYRFDRLKGAFVSKPIEENVVPGVILLTGPVTMTLDAVGDIYVGNESTEEFGDRGGIQRYDGTTGAWLGKFTDVGTRGIAFGPDGKLYACNVAVANNAVVMQIDTNGTFIGNYTAVLGKQLQYPLWHNGDLYVTQAAENKILKISNGGSNVTDFVAAGAGGLSTPAGFAFTPDGDLLVTMGTIGGGANMIKRYNGSTGAYLGDFASLPSDVRPAEVAIEVVPPVETNDYVYFVCTDGVEEPAASGNEDKVFKFDSSDALVGALDDHPDDDSTSEYARYSGMALGPDGLLYVSSLNFDAVYRWDPDDGTSVDKWVSHASLLNQVDDIAFGGPNPNDLYAACQSPGTKRIEASPDNVATGIVAVTDPSTHTAVGWGPDALVSTGRFMYVGWSGSRIQIWDEATTNFVQDMARGNEGQSSLIGLQGFPAHVQWQDDYMYVASKSNILYYTHIGSTPSPPEVRGRFLGEFVSAPGGTDFQGFDFAPNGDLLVATREFGAPTTNSVHRYDGRNGAFLGKSDLLPNVDGFGSGLVVYERIVEAIPSSLLDIGVATNQLIAVTFDSVSGQTYDVQLESDLVTGAWTNDPGNENIAGTGTNIVITIDSPQDAQGIRVSSEVD